VDPDFEDEFPGASARATECYANIVRTGDLLIGLHNEQARSEYGLSATGKQALAVLEGARQPLEPGVIAERLIITSGSTTSILDTLERAGLVQRMPHPDDRRKLLVEVTDEGVAIVDELLPSLHQRERTIMDDALGPAEQRTLLELLAKVQASLARHTDDPPARGARRINRHRHNRAREGQARAR
jgi:DNA-binding MarR family transcriptional regulator